MELMITFFDDSACDSETYGPFTSISIDQHLEITGCKPQPHHGHPRIVIASRDGHNWRARLPGSERRLWPGFEIFPV